jgi:hypothetical protein
MTSDKKTTATPTQGASGSPHPSPPPEYRGRGKRAPRPRAGETAAQTAARANADAIVEQAVVGASLFEIAAYHEVEEVWLKKTFGRAIVKAWARRNIAIRRALTAQALKGNLAAIRRITELDRGRNERQKALSRREDG